jgi:prepilin-type N-terminal cleavage/methylation domain-containing protein
MQRTLERLSRHREGMAEESGFTLIELLVVVVILGILAAIVVFAVVGVTGSSAQAACKSDWKTVEIADNAYKAQTGSWATAVSQLAITTTDSNGATIGPWLNAADLTGGSLKNSNHYQIVVTTSGTVQVFNVPTPPTVATQIGASNSLADCNTVS